MFGVGNDAASALLAAAAMMEHAEVGHASPSTTKDSPARPGKPRRCEKSRDQKEILIRAFDEDPLPDFERRQALALQLGISPRAVQVWFQNRRARLKPPHGGAARPRESKAQQSSGGALGSRGESSRGAPSGASELQPDDVYTCQALTFMRTSANHHREASLDFDAQTGERWVQTRPPPSDDVINVDSTPATTDALADSPSQDDEGASSSTTSTTHSHHGSSNGSSNGSTCGSSHGGSHAGAAAHAATAYDSHADRYDRYTDRYAVPEAAYHSSSSSNGSNNGSNGHTANPGSPTSAGEGGGGSSGCFLSPTMMSIAQSALSNVSPGEKIPFLASHPAIRHALANGHHVPPEHLYAMEHHYASAEGCATAAHEHGASPPHNPHGSGGAELVLVSSPPPPPPPSELPPVVPPIESEGVVEGGVVEGMAVDESQPVDDHLVAKVKAAAAYSAAIAYQAAMDAGMAEALAFSRGPCQPAAPSMPQGSAPAGLPPAAAAAVVHTHSPLPPALPPGVPPSAAAMQPMPPMPPTPPSPAAHVSAKKQVFVWKTLNMPDGMPKQAAIAYKKADQAALAKATAAANAAVAAMTQAAPMSVTTQQTAQAAQ